MHALINYLSSIQPATWQMWLTTTVAFLGGGGAIASVLQYLKKRHQWDSKVFIHGILVAFSLIASASDYLISHAATSPLPTIFGNGTKLLAAAVIVHRFAVSPASGWIEKQVLSLVKDANEYRALTRPQTMAPADPSTSDFTV